MLLGVEQWEHIGQPNGVIPRAQHNAPISFMAIAFPEVGMLSEEVVASGVLMLLGVRSIWGVDATRGGLVGGGGQS